MPLSVCLLCHKINKNEELEELDFNVGNNVPSYQICIGKGTDMRTPIRTLIVL